MKERLIELIGKGERSMWGKSIHGIEGQREALADFLLENGVIVPPCKVGDTIYQAIFHKCEMGFCVERMVVGFHMGEFPKLRGQKRKQYFVVFHKVTNDLTHLDFEQIGKTVFFTREEAEKALRERVKR